MKIVIDKHIPFLQETLGELPFEDVQVLYVAPENISHAIIFDADALIVRTRTKIDAALLYGTRVRFIASATIGSDHIDTTYCDQNNIYYTACPGCNSKAVCDYVSEVIDTFKDLLPKQPTIGIIGYGHIGSLVGTMAEKKNFHVLFNDAPKQIGVSLNEITRRSDIITFHVPLKQSHPYPTFHLCNDCFLEKCKPNVIIINASRGGVVDEKSLLDYIQKRKIGGVAIDCWENEPHINKEMLQIPIPHLFSYHIAGYSLQGKYNASQMCLDALCQFFRLPALSIDKNLLNLRRGDSSSGWLMRVDDELCSTPNDFEQLRKRYLLR